MRGQVADEKPITAGISEVVDGAVKAVQQATPTAALQEDRELMPLPTDPRTIFLGGLFLLAVFFAPLAAAIPGYATAPALIVVGALMTESIGRVAWADFTDAIPAFVTLLATPLTFSIATGLSLGLISYTLVKVAAGKFREISPVIWILTVLFIFRYAYLAAE